MAGFSLYKTRFHDFTVAELISAPAESIKYALVPGNMSIPVRVLTAYGAEDLQDTDSLCGYDVAGFTLNSSCSLRVKDQPDFCTKRCLCVHFRDHCRGKVRLDTMTNGQLYGTGPWDGFYRLC